MTAQCLWVYRHPLYIWRASAYGSTDILYTYDGPVPEGLQASLLHTTARQRRSIMGVREQMCVGMCMNVYVHMDRHVYRSFSFWSKPLRDVNARRAVADGAVQCVGSGAQDV